MLIAGFWSVSSISSNLLSEILAFHRETAALVPSGPQTLVWR